MKQGMGTAVVDRLDVRAGALAHEVRIAAAPGVVLSGWLSVHRDGCSRGVLVYAGGAGSCITSPCNRLLAGMLAEAGGATLLLDLLTPLEHACRVEVFDLELLARRLVAASDWLRRQPETAGIEFDYVDAGDSTEGRVAEIASDLLLVHPADDR